MNPLGHDDKSKKLAARDPQEGLGWVHLKLVRPHEVKHLPKISKMIAFVETLDGNVVNVAFDSLTGEFGENFIHCPLISDAGVLQPKGHECVAVYPQGCPEG